MYTAIYGDRPSGSGGVCAAPTSTPGAGGGGGAPACTNETHLLSGALVFRAALDFYIQIYAGFMRFYFLGCVYPELFIEIYIRFYFLTCVFLCVYRVRSRMCRYAVCACEK